MDALHRGVAENNREINSSNMKIFILGSTGMLGYALMKEANLRKLEVTALARRDAEICLDVTDSEALKRVIQSERPDVVINTVAVVNLEKCEKDPAYSYLVNARPSSILADICDKLGIYYIYVSTDHFYTHDGERKHGEDHPITIVNEYARTKYAGECFTTINPSALVVRTNIVGFHYHKFEQPTFVEWIIKSIETRAEITMFYDYIASSIDVRRFSQALFDLIEKKTTGILNVACRDAKSKKAFIEAMASHLRQELQNARSESVLSLRGVPRAASLGLDVTRAERILGYALPTFDQVISSLVEEYNYNRKGLHSEV